jgi:multiple sugar transport system substrate-binding protein
VSAGFERQVAVEVVVGVGADLRDCRGERRPGPTFQEERSMKHQRLMALLAVAAVVTVAGCSSSKSKASAPSSAAPSASASSASAPAAATSAPAAASTPASPAPASSAAASDVSAPTTITVNCEPPTTAAAQRTQWLDDVASFEKLHPNITINSKDEAPCDDPNTFSAKLASGQEENVFYLYLTDTQQAIDSGQALDIQPYAASIPGLSDIQSSVLNVFKKGGAASGDLYGLPKTNYTLGLVYNRALFTAAGLDPNSPPTTWADVNTDAKKIAALGNGDIGYADYSAGNTGGWHFTAEMYSQGGDVVDSTGKKADFDNAKGLAVINNLKQMRWTDNDMGSKQLLQYQDTINMMAAGHLGMTIGAPDYLTNMQQTDKANLSGFGMGAMPSGANGSGTLLGGDGYMFNKSDTPDQVKAGLLWLEYENLTPGTGQFNYSRAASLGNPVGLPEPDLFQGATATTDAAAKAASANLPVANYQPYITVTPNLQGNVEPPDAQAIYKVLDGLMSAVLTNQSADPQKLLDQYSAQVNQVLAQS